MLFDFSIKGIKLMMVLVMCYGNVNAQSSLTIKVEDMSKRAVPMVNAFLTLSDSIPMKSSYSDSTGLINFSDIPFGEYLVFLKCVGYQDTACEVNHLRNTEVKSITLKHDTFSTVDVTYEKPLIEIEKGLITVNIGETILKGAGSVYDMLGKMPGITYDAQGGLAYRGRSGINVRMDSRQLRMSSSELKNYLSSMSADEIEKVEIQSNPGAMEDAEGSGAIINIVTKVGKKLGLNGTVTAALERGKKWRGNAGVSLNYRPSVKLNVYGNYTFSGGSSVATFDNNRNIETTNVFIKEDIQNAYQATGHAGKFGVDYQINKKSDFGVIFTVNTSSNNTKSESTINNFHQELPDTVIQFLGDNTDGWNEYASGLFYGLELDSAGSRLEVSSDYARYHTTTNANLNSTFFLQDINVKNEIRDNVNNSVIDLASAKIDISKVFKKWQLDIGGKVSYAKTDNNFEAFIAENNVLVPDLKRSNHFLYDEYILAAYGNYSAVFNSIDVSVGIRPEYSQLQGNSVSIDSSFERSFFSFFPSVYIGKQLSTKNRLDFAYTRKLNRPNYRDLTPFEMYITNYSLWKGNPSLQPQFTNTLSVTHTLNNQVWSTFSYAYTSQMFMPTVIQNDVTKTFSTINTNFGSSHFAGFFIYATHNLKKWWSIINNAGVYYSEIIDRRELNNPVTIFSNIQGYYINSASYFTLSKGFRGELSLRYNGPSLGLWSTKSFFSVDAGVSKSFKNGVSLSLQFINILNTVRYINEYDYQNVDYRSQYIPELQKVRLSLSWPFGKSTLDQSKDRIESSQDEKNRVTQ